AAWLNGLAQQLASTATQGCGQAVARLWDVVDAGGTVGPNDARLATVDAQVDRFFQHPADCDFWRPLARAAIGSEALGPELLEQLADAHAGTPDVPSHVAIPPDHPVNRPAREAHP